MIRSVIERGSQKWIMWSVKEFCTKDLLSQRKKNVQDLTFWSTKICLYFTEHIYDSKLFIKLYIGKKLYLLSQNLMQYINKPTCAEKRPT